jgi:hypothetical protein
MMANGSSSPVFRGFTMTVRTVLVSAAACLLLASSHTPAQAPPAASDIDQRLKALEAKMDRVLKALEGHAPAPATSHEVAQKQLDLLIQAKDALLIKADQAQQAYADFRVKSPFLISPKDSDSSIAGRRVAKDEALLMDLYQRQTEVSARSALAKNVGDNENQARALLILLQRRGVDVELLRRTGAPARDESQTAVALVRLYAESLRLEGEELKRLVLVADERLDQNRKVLREMYVYQITEERLRATKDQSIKLLDAIIMQLAKIDVARNLAPKP